MLFNSVSFVIFLPIVFCVYWLLPDKFRWFLLLAASYYFYMSWNPKYVVLILSTTLVSYGAAILLKNPAGGRKNGFWQGSCWFAWVYFSFLNILTLFRKR